MISYAQNFEDVVLDRVFKNVRQGSYIDVGAYDPVEDSVTKTFYDRGWSGINVEPVKTLYQKLVHQRPRDQNMNVAVGRHAGQIEFQNVQYSDAQVELPDLTILGISTPYVASCAKYGNSHKHIWKYKLVCHQ